MTFLKSVKLTLESGISILIHGVISLPEMKTRVVCQNISRYVISIDTSRLVHMNKENIIIRTKLENFLFHILISKYFSLQSSWLLFVLFYLDI